MQEPFVISEIKNGIATITFYHPQSNSMPGSQLNMLANEIEKLMAPLDEREREILALRFGLDRGEPRTLEEVGAHFDLTRERIRQIEARAMSKLRHPSADTGARDLISV